MMIQGIACSIFKKEIESLFQQKIINIPFIFFDSMLHIYPSELDDKIRDLTGKQSKENKSIVLVCGDCSPNMNIFESTRNISRVTAINCCEILLGREQYRKYRSEGVFFLMPEWTIRWREVFNNHLGLNSETAKAFMKELHSKLIYIDTGLYPVPEGCLDEISKYTGLDCSIIKVSLEKMVAAINKAMDNL